MTVEVDDRGGGEEWVQSSGVAEIEHDACNPGAFGWCVEVLGDRRDELVGGVDVVVRCGVEEPLDLGAADLWERERESEITFGELDQFVEEVLEFIFIETAQSAGGVVGVTGDERAREIVLGGSTLLAAAVLGLAA